MMEGVLRRVLQLVFGSGADISNVNPLPVTDTGCGKAVSGVLDQPIIAAATTTTLADCVSCSLGESPRTLALTIEAMYNAIATAGIRVHVISSYGDVTGGFHTGGMGVAVLTDANNHFIVNELVGLTVVNQTDGSSGVITANTLNTVTAVLAGGIANVWNTNDVYYINGAGYDTVDYDTWNPAFAAGIFIRQTKPYNTDPRNLKVLIENLDPLQQVIDVTAAFTWENRS